MKKILIYFDQPNPPWGYFPWWLHDPLILSEARIKPEVRIVPQQEKHSYPDLSRETIWSYSLVIVPYPHHIREEYIKDLLEYLDNGGALLLVQPMFDSCGLSSSLGEKTGVVFQGGEKETPTYSLITDHPAARILGLPEGRSVYPHRNYAPHMKFELENGAVLTRTSFRGDPDIFVSLKTKIAIAATDIFNDLESYHRGCPEYYAYRQNIGYLLINAVRYLLGYSFVNQPIQKTQQRWSDLFYAYAAGREYISSIQKSLSDRLSKDELSLGIDKADDRIEQAAKALMQGKIEECKQLYNTGVKLLSECMDKMTKVGRYIIRGWHASILFDDYYGGGLLGYAECEWMDHLIQWMAMQLNWIMRTGSRRINDISPMTWEIMAKYYPEDVQLFKEATKEGLLEAVRGMYTQAYLPLLSAECNVRQFFYGLKELKKSLDTEIEVFLDARDHYDFHPQLPQILRNFGFKFAILRCHDRMGEIRPIHAEKIRWRGLDGTEIEAVPTYEGIQNPWLWSSHPELVAKADQLGYETILLGDVVDATSDFPGEKEHTLLNPIAPIVGKWTTGKGFFERTSKAERSFFLGVDDLYARYLEQWSSFGCMNEAYEWNRSTESLILSAEKFGAVTSVLGRAPKECLKNSQKSIEESWKNLLATQDHMAFGSVNYDKQIPPLKLKPGEEKTGKHCWGYHLGLLPRQLATIGAMDNYGEMGTENYAGPMIPVSRYEKVKECIELSRENAAKILNEALNYIATKINAAQTGKDGLIPVVVFNQLGWRKKDIVTIEKEFPEGKIHNFVLSDGNKGISYQVVSTEKHGDGSMKKIKVLFLADIPSLGYKTYFLKPIAEETVSEPHSLLKASSTQLENDYYVVEINALHGGISRIFDKDLGIDLLDTSIHFGNELCSPEDPGVSSRDSQAKVELTEKGPLRATMRIQSRIGEVPYECLISIYKDFKRIDFNLNVDYRKGFNFGTHKKDGTGLFTLFPISFAGKLFVNQPFGIYETKKKKQFTLDFADLYQGEYGFCLIHRNTPGYYYDNGILSLILSQGRPLVVAKQNYQYSIYTHKADPCQGDVFKIAQSLYTPVVLCWPDHQEGELCQESSFLTIDKENIVLSAFYSEEDTLYARFYEISGKSTHANVVIPWIESPECFRVKLNKEKMQKVKCINGKMELDFNSWEIVTIAFSSVL